MHFAAHTIVPESVANPLKYYGNNTCATRNLLECCQRAGVRHFVFSSTAAVYGIPADGLAREDTPTAPINPYGTVEADERVDAARPGRGVVTALRRAALLQRRRQRPGVSHRSHVAPGARCSSRLPARGRRSASAQRRRSSAPTTRRRTARACATTSTSRISRTRTCARSTTCGRRRSTTLNCGYGHGYSVREVLATVAARARGAARVNEAPRRAGDPPSLVAQRDRVREVLGWSPRFDDLEVIVRTQLEWEHRLLREPGLQRN